MILKLLSRAVLVLIFSPLLGCVSWDSATVSDSDQSLMEIKKAVVAVMGEPRTISENQREFTSQYFSKKPDPKGEFDPQKSKVRHYAVMTILGARRPYDIEIRAFVERKKGKEYESEGEDSDVAHRLAKELKDKLNQSRDNRNLIDDFRAF